MRICSPYKPPNFVDIPSVGDSITVQGLVTSLSVILSGHDDNNMKSLELGYSEQVRDLYPEMFGRPTKYELEYYQQQQGEHEPGGPSDIPPADSSPAAAPSEPGTPETTPEK